MDKDHLPGDNLEDPRAGALMRQERGVTVVEIYGEIDISTVRVLDEVLDEAIAEVRSLDLKLLQTGMPESEASETGIPPEADGYRGAVGQPRGSPPLRRRVVADLRPSGFMECRALRSLIIHADALLRIGGELVLVVREGGEVERLIGVSGLSESFPLYTNLDAAILRAYRGHSEITKYPEHPGDRP